MTPEPVNYPGAVFDPERVDLVLSVFQRLRHTQGQWAGRPLRPDPWQICYILAPIFGWVALNTDELDPLIPPFYSRIIRKAWIEVPRKNGKTTLAGGIAAYMTTADGEPGAQVYAVAAGTRQAKYCFDPVKAIAMKSPDLAPYVRITTERIHHTPSGSFFAAVSSIAELLHGANVHCAIVDEVHVHKNGDVLEAVETGMGARRQPLMLCITTADDSRQDTVYDQRRRRIEQLAEGIFEDSSTFGVIWAAEPEQNAFRETTWKSSNPGYGVSPTRTFMKSAALQAQQSPANLSNFLRLHLNRRTKQEVVYLEMGAWDASEIEFDESDLEGKVCYGGLDLSNTSDLCALCWVFPWEGGFRAIWRLWVPEGGPQPANGLYALNRRTSGNAQAWVDQGFLKVTPGNVADYDFIKEQILTDLKSFKVRELAYDPWNATQVVSDLMANDAPMIEHRQGFASMSAPTKEMQKLTRGGPNDPRFFHSKNPVVRWTVDNFAVEMDAQGNVKPSRAKASDKIDPVVAAIMGLNSAIRNAEPDYKLEDSVM